MKMKTVIINLIALLQRDDQLTAVDATGRFAYTAQQ